jgi:hypothetical protein
MPITSDLAFKENPRILTIIWIPMKMVQLITLTQTRRQHSLSFDRQVINFTSKLQTILTKAEHFLSNQKKLKCL